MKIMLACSEVSPKNKAKPKHLMILLHGVGASKDDLIGLADEFKDTFPDMHFISPDAPFSYDGAPFGRQWFSLDDRNEAALVRGLNLATPYLDKFIDAQLRRFDLTEDDLIVVGFSQGTMVALHALLRRPKPVALVVGFAGMMVAPGLLEAEMKSKPALILLHGEADQVIPVSYMKAAAAQLKRLGVDVQTNTYKNLGHALNEQELADAADAIKLRLKV